MTDDDNIRKINPLDWLAKPRKGKTEVNPILKKGQSSSSIEEQGAQTLEQNIGKPTDKPTGKPTGKPIPALDSYDNIPEKLQAGFKPTLPTLEREPILCGLMIGPENHIINEEGLPKPSIEPFRKNIDTNEQNPILLKISKETLNTVGLLVRDGESLINNKYPDSIKLEEHIVFKDKSYMLTKKSNPKQSTIDKFTTQTIEETRTTQAKIDLTSYLKIEHIVNNYSNELEQLSQEQSKKASTLRAVSKYKINIQMESASVKQNLFSGINAKTLRLTIYVSSLEQHSIIKELFNILNNVILLGPEDTEGTDGDWLDFLRNSMK